jgi:hypothetical protein
MDAPSASEKEAAKLVEAATAPENEAPVSGLSESNGAQEAKTESKGLCF